MFSNLIPIYFSLLFLILFFFPVIMVSKLAAKAQVKNGFKIVFGFYFTYLVLVAVASHFRFFDTVMLPPKIVLTTTIPLAILLTVVFTTKKCQSATDNLTLENLVGIHIFRLIGSFFIILLLHDLLPPVFALVAGLGDLITAITSVFVVRQIKKKTLKAKKLTLIWNTFGFIDIVATSAMAILFTKFSIDNGTQGVEFLVEFPFCFIPAFAPATIIFLHLLVYRKLKSTK